MYFLSSYMTKQTASDWLVIYMGVGNGERFRWLRDEFFPSLAVVAYDPIDSFYPGDKGEVERNADLWSNDGTNFIFHVRCFDFENDTKRIRERFKGRQILLISDIRGVALLNENNDYDGANPPCFDKAHDQDLQWKFIQCLRPVSSLCKFTTPDPWEQYFEYAPGVVLKQIFTNYPSLETRLLIEGVPERSMRYNAWELYEQMTIHHEQLRGLVHATTRSHNCTACLDYCFDCTVLWDTVSSYASRNQLDPYNVLDTILKCQVWAPSDCARPSWMTLANYTWEAPSSYRRWWDVDRALKSGNVMEAIAALEYNVSDTIDEKAAVGEKDCDWADIADSIDFDQPDVASRLRLALKRPATRNALVEALGQLSEPFTLIRTDMNTLFDYSKDEKVAEDTCADPAEQACSGG